MQCIIEDAKKPKGESLYPTISHFSDQELLEIVDSLGYDQLNRWFKHHKFDKGYHFSPLSYAYISSKLNGFIWLSDAEIQERRSSGKKFEYLTQNDLIFEQVYAILYNNDVNADELWEQVALVIGRRNKLNYLKIKINIIEELHAFIKKASVITEEEKKEMAAYKRKVINAYNNHGIHYKDVSLNIHISLCRKYYLDPTSLIK